LTAARRQSLIHGGLFVAIAVVLALLGPWLDRSGRGAVLSGLSHNLMYDICINVILGLGLNLVLGITGQFSIGHAAFLASGAYTAIIVAGKPAFLLPQLRFWHEMLHLPGWMAFVMVFLAGAVAAIIVSSVIGFVVGLPALRLRGDYLAIATLGFGEIVAVVITNWGYVGGATGADLYGMRSMWEHAVTGAGPGGGGQGQEALAALVHANLTDSRYLIGSFWVFFGVLVSIYVVRNIKYSTSGRALLAVREDVTASEAVGVPTTRYKVGAFVVGAGLAGLAGALLSHHKTINPESFTFLRSIEIVLIVILGGQGSITGTILAAALITLLPEALRSGVPQSWNIDPSLIEKWRLVIYSLLIILAMLFRPQGLFGRYEIGDLVAWALGRRGRKPSAAEAGSQKSEGESLPQCEASPAQAGVPLLAATKVTMQFGGLKAVDDFNLELFPGELVGLIGPNGAGKTTVFNVLTGVCRPTLGVVAVGGRSMVGAKPHAISQRGIARTFQNIRLFGNLSVLDNVMIAQHVHHKQGIPSAILRTPAFYREEAASRNNALGYLGLFGLEEQAEECANSLSYGDQRRLEIARALATRPRILLLDEPAAGMNPTEKRELMEMIRSIRKRFSLTILIIEHDMKVIMGVCERILVLDYGRTIASGTPEEIRRNPAVIEAYLGAPGATG
jgi:branched-chain amino acid transport system permease protein